MNKDNYSPLCSESESFYFDFASKAQLHSIPKNIIEHIKNCAYCQKQIDRIQNSFYSKGVDFTGTVNKCSGLSEILSLHLHYNDKLVNCSIVRPFLPTFLVESMCVTVPTPITVHLDNCKQCQHDLATIRELNLEHNQLEQLSMHFSYNLSNNKKSCNQANLYIQAFVDLDLDEIDFNTLWHLCKCPICQDKIYELRQEKIANCPSEIGSAHPLSCDEISYNDLFYYCYPINIDSAADQYSKFCGSFTKHLVRCPKCLANLQKLNHIISTLDRQSDSGIITKYHVTACDQKSIRAKEKGTYSGFPVEVEISKQRENEKAKQRTFLNDINALRKWFSKNRVKTLTRIAAAAVITLAVGLFFINLPSASAITIEKVYDAIAAINNVHIKSFVAGDDKPTQEQWVSRSLGLYMTKTGEDLVLWDANNAVKKLKKGSFDSIIETRLEPADSVAIKQRIKSSFGLVPFEKPSAIPKDHTWEQLYLEGLGEKIEVFELSWSKKSYTGDSHYKKWRVFLDKTTHLPQKIEYYEKLEGLTDDYELVETKEVGYLDDAEMKLFVNVHF